MKYPGGKNKHGVYQKIISMMPPHKIYIEGFLGSGAVLRNKKPAKVNIGIDKDIDCIDYESFPNIPLELINTSALDYFNFLMKYPPFKTKETLIYCDPPYLQSVRKSKSRIYNFEFMTEAEHIQLLEILLTLPCNVMISGYDSPLYNKMLSTWRKVAFETTDRRNNLRTEIIWMNFPEPLELHDYQYLGHNFRERERIKKKRLRWKNKLENMPSQERFALMAEIENLRLGSHHQI